MSQSAILQYLKAHPNEYLSPKQIQENVDCLIGSVMKNLQKLRQNQDVIYKDGLWGMPRLYKHKPASIFNSK